jgi:hypothetical protein
MIATPLLYIDHTNTTVAHIWDLFYTGGRLPRVHGDQNFVDKAIHDLWGALYRGIYEEFPLNFMTSYKVWFGNRGGRWKVAKQRLTGYEFDDFITMTFNGRPWIDEVVLKKLDGYEHFRDFVNFSKLSVVDQK